MLAPINDIPTYGRVIAERARLAPTGDEDHPLGVSIVPIPNGEVEYTRGQQDGQWIQSAELRRHDKPLPPASRQDAVWIGEDGIADRYRRIALQVRHDEFSDARVGIFVARSEAWPEGYTPRPGQVIWSAGIDTWRKLAARGQWVHGSEESLGESGIQTLSGLFPRVHFRHMGWRAMLKWRPSGLTCGKTMMSLVSTILRTCARVNDFLPSRMAWRSR